MSDEVREYEAPKYYRGFVFSITKYAYWSVHEHHKQIARGKAENVVDAECEAYAWIDRYINWTEGKGFKPESPLPFGKES